MRRQKNIKSNSMINIKTITPDELKFLSLSKLVTICKNLDNSNGDWEDVTEDEHEYILKTAINFITEFQK